MKIEVNGEQKHIKIKRGKPFLSSTLEYLGYSNNTVVVELNDIVINSKKWANLTLKDGDKLEIVSIVGGG